LEVCGRCGMKRGSITFRSRKEAEPVRIVADAALAIGTVKEGRLVPVLLLDALQRPDIAELIRVHEVVSPGDVQVLWGQRDGQKGTVALFLEFERPVVLSIVLEFNIDTQGGLVDLIVRSRSVYLQSGREGDRFITTTDAPRIIIDIPDTEFEPQWEKLALSALTDSFRRRGMRRARAREAAGQFLKEWRTFANSRMVR
jgi:hypothetical protein